jgi:uncharacterized lipoprotein YehR (DUF1307 family)
VESRLRGTQFTHYQFDDFSSCGDSEKDRGYAARILGIRMTFGQQSNLNKTMRQSIFNKISGAPVNTAVGTPGPS